MRFGVGALCVALFCVVLGSPVAHAMSWSVCDAGTSLYRPEAVSLTPDPPIAGQEAKFAISGTLDGNSVPGGRVEYKILVLGFPIYENSIDLCETTACPIVPGNYVVELTQNLPSYAPAGNYHLQVNIFDDDNNELSCVKVDFKLVHSAAADAADKGRGFPLSTVNFPGGSMPKGGTLIRVIRNLLGFPAGSTAGASAASLAAVQASSALSNSLAATTRVAIANANTRTRLNAKSASPRSKPCRRCLSEKDIETMIFDVESKAAAEESAAESADDSASTVSIPASVVKHDHVAHRKHKELKHRIERHKNRPKMRVVGAERAKQVALHHHRHV